MTPQEKKEAVRQAIVRAVPSVMDLVFGCQIKTSKSQIGIILVDRKFDCDALIEGIRRNVGKKHFEIIGRPIQLADVLVAIGSICDNSPANIGGFTRDLLNNGWILSQDFEHQSEATISFLYELMGCLYVR